MLSAVKDMEASFDERELGLACLKLALKLDQEGEVPEKTHSFADKSFFLFCRSSCTSAGWREVNRWEKACDGARTLISLVIVPGNIVG